VLGVVVVLAGVGCSEDRASAGPRMSDPLPADVEVGEDAPVDLTYVCGNHFLVSNTHDVPISVTYRVGGTSEEGTVEVPAAPPDDPAVSEQLMKARTNGTVQIFLDGKPLVARANEGVPCPPPPAAAAFVAASPDQGGQWSATFAWPIVGVHMTLLPDGRVLAFGRTATPQVFDPLTRDFTQVPSSAWLFCAGHTLLSDGRVLLAGGHISDNHGLPNITYFSGNGTWTSGAPMARGRWYPTTTTMGNGDVVITAGRDQAGVVVTIPEVWSSGSVRQLTGAPQSLPYYPRQFLAPGGTVYVAGSARNTHFLSVAGAGSWRKGPTKMLAREYGSAVMYDDGKILYAGGARTTNTAEVLDLNQAAPKWTWTGSMAFARRHHNLTVLPTGEVLATGGVAGTAFNDVTKGVRAAEIWNPATGQWTTLASNAVTRGYHGTSLLLPDGRVLNAGSGDGAGAPNERNAEFFSPPYLFRGAQPTITSAPSEVRYGAEFRILTPDAGAITHVSLIRLGAVTHAFDQNQRFQRLSFTRDGTGLTVTAPSSPNRAPPGHYLVFILNQDDVPSIARIVRIF
jgi:galactose oxidase